MRRVAPLLAAAALAACTPKTAPKTTADAGPASGKAAADVVDTGDLDAVQKRHVLRALVFGHGEELLPRAGASTLSDRDLAAQLAQSLGVELQPIAVAKYADLVPMLLAGKGDLIVARLAQTAAREKQIAFSRPTAVVDEMLIGKAGDRLKDVAALAGKTVTVRKSSSYRQTLDELAQKEAKGVVIADAAEDEDTEALVHDVATGKIAYTVCDSDLFANIAAYTSGVAALFPLKQGRQIGFGIRKENAKLKAAADAFLVAHAVTTTSKPSTGDLDAIKKRGSVRMLTRNNAVSYFLHKGTQQGFDYALMKLFAKDNGLRLDVIVPPDADDLVPWLLAGKGDVIAAQMTVTPERSAKIAFSEPYLSADEVLVQRAGEKPIGSVDELLAACADKKTISVRKSSSYRATLDALKLPAGCVVDAPEDRETEELIGDVAAGSIALTVADSNIADVELTYRSDVQKTLTLKPGQPIAYGVRKDDVKLLAALNAFVNKRYRGLEFNVLKKTYFENKHTIDAAHSEAMRTTGHISPYDALLKRHSRAYGLDWRLMASQSYQESRFDPHAKSWVGAQGLFQVMPATGKEMGFLDLTDPDQGVHAGIEYMAGLIDDFDADLPFKQRVRFALASYNAGKGHVEDARRLAAEMGLNPNKWFGNVEKAMLRLQDPKVARKARHGYCRGEETVKYVSEIQSRYDNYLTVVKDLGAQSRP